MKRCYSPGYKLVVKISNKGMDKMKKCFGISIILIIMILFSACSNDRNKQAEEKEIDFNIYYINSKTFEIVSEIYRTTTTNRLELVNELMDVLRKGPDKITYKKALPDSVKIKEFVFNEDDRLTINFDTSYNDLTGISEILCRATVVKTLCQINGIEYVEFYVNGQPLKNIDGSIVGLMTQDRFLESTGTQTYYKVSLFFANKEGDALIETDTNIHYTGTGSIEELVIKQLINGPTENGLYNTIPEGTTLLNVSTKEGICYVDFNEKFLEKVPNITNDELVIYSVVNTLVELPNSKISKVQFLINGAVQEKYRESIDFNGIFERNLNLVEE